MFKWIWNTFLDLVYPRPEECPLCGRSWSIGRYPGAVVCFRCVERLGARRTQSICECCGRYEAENHGAFSQKPRPESAFYCGECQDHPPLFSRARAIGLYEGLLREAIHAFKYQGKITLARPLGKLLAGVIKEELRTEPALVVPVPLHPKRAFERGFNQAELLAEVVAQELNWEWGREVLMRVVHTPPQARLGRRERLSNIQSGVFRAQQPERVRGQPILLIDDVLTSGITCGECTRVLQQAGSGSVQVATVATSRVIVV